MVFDVLWNYGHAASRGKMAESPKKYTIAKSQTGPPSNDCTFGDSAAVLMPERLAYHSTQGIRCSSRLVRL